MSDDQSRSRRSRPGRLFFSVVVPARQRSDKRRVRLIDRLEKRSRQNDKSDGEGDVRIFEIDKGGHERSGRGRRI